MCIASIRPLARGVKNYKKSRQRDTREAREQAGTGEETPERTDTGDRKDQI